MGIRTGLGELRGDGRGWTLLAIAVGWVFILGGRFLVPAVLPQVKAAFDASDFEVGVAITVIWAAYALMQSPGGLLIDRFGERRLLAGSLLLTAASILVLGTAPVFLAFLVGSCVFGLASGLYGPARGTALSRTFPENDGTAIGITLAAGAVGSAALPFLAGALVGTYSWRLIVGGLLPPLALAGLLVWLTVPETANGAAQVSPGRLVRDVTNAIRHRGIVIATAGVTLIMFAYQGLTAFLVTYLVAIKEFDQTTAAAVLSLFFIGGAISQIVSGTLSDRFGDRPVLVGVAALNVPLLVALPFLEGVIPIAALSLLLGTRNGVMPVSNAYTIAVLPDRVTGATWGVLRTGFFLLGAAGSTVVGAMADADLFDESFFVLAALTAAAALIYAFLPDRATSRGG
ncbi:MFS transporter [Halanaeroarchaeum sulfurireducens]|uniref:Major facilitator superfamily transporter n=1 Tax=Halanaeroarchaeum sulfurireducens TaxID=1604004 RepID=A0A0N9NCQ9_9EURY|nr:MFS transporter [Halanaeroarchaeum sulfurireducens]ALG82800.1 major facilitator superfamily transporter [Halanaeroarchaeum sulfurireducens]